MLLSDDGSSTRPDNVALVRDPVLSDKTLTDTGGACWKQSEGACRTHKCESAFLAVMSHVEPSVGKSRVDLVCNRHYSWTCHGKLIRAIVCINFA